jgi:hypothetical protein
MRLGKRVFVRLTLCVTALTLVAGCRQGPSRVEAPSWDPDGFADAVVAKLDKNSDSAVDMTEVTAAPGLAWGAVYIDTDNNKSLSRDELMARFEKYKNLQLGLTSKTMQVSYKGRPVAGAKVTLVPEFFLEGVVEPAGGETFEDGTFNPQTQGMDLSGVRAGYYRIVVESPRVKVPAKYASAESTAAGVEISPLNADQRSYGNLQVVLRD